jgi:Flp pilus assembly pilin Flp
MTNLLNRFVSDESGQGITEYGAILAFVAILIVVVAGFVSGTLRSALSNAFSLIGSALNNLNSQVS